MSDYTPKCYVCGNVTSFYRPMYCSTCETNRIMRDKQKIDSQNARDIQSSNDRIVAALNDLIFEMQKSKQVEKQTTPVSVSEPRSFWRPMTDEEAKEYYKRREAFKKRREREELIQSLKYIGAFLSVVALLVLAFRG